MVAQGQFPATNTYPKIVTAVDLNDHDNSDLIIDLWLGGYLRFERGSRERKSVARSVHGGPGYPQHYRRRSHGRNTHYH